MPATLTKLLAAVYAALAYLLQDPVMQPLLGVHPRLYGGLSALLVFLAALQLSGKQIAPKIAAALGNAGAKPELVVPKDLK